MQSVGNRQRYNKIKNISSNLSMVCLLKIVDNDNDEREEAEMELR